MPLEEYRRSASKHGPLIFIASGPCPKNAPPISYVPKFLPVAPPATGDAHGKSVETLLDRLLRDQVDMGWA